jgi:hypothetical protein
MSSACCVSAYFALQSKTKMSHQVFFQSREDKIHVRTDIFSRLSDRCFEKEKHAWTFENDVNTLAHGVEGGLASQARSNSVVSVPLQAGFRIRDGRPGVSHRSVEKGDRSSFPS